MQDNIAAFGGDTQNVDVIWRIRRCPQRAVVDGFAVGEGAFHKAIIQSGYIAAGYAPRGGAKKARVALAEHLALAHATAEQLGARFTGRDVLAAGRAF